MSDRYRVPVATYRVQMHGGFTFDDLRAIVDHLDDLGITDVYTSPLMTARKGSTHGYDVVDPSKVNPELGGEEGLVALSEALRERDIGLVLDIVPNHMAVSEENGWWMDVLENGTASRFVQFFDIDWSSSGRRGRRVLLPVLGRPYGECLRNGELQLVHEHGAIRVGYWDHRFPLAAESYAAVFDRCAERIVEREGADSAVAAALRELVHKPTLPGTDDLAPSIPGTEFLRESLSRFLADSALLREVLDQVLVEINGTKGDEQSFDLLDEILDQQWYRLAYWRVASEEINYRRFFDISDLVGVRVEDPEVFEVRHAKIFDLIERGIVTGLRIDHIDGLFDPIAHLRRLQMRLGGIEAAESPHFWVVVEKILEGEETLDEQFAASGTTGYEYLNALNALFVDPAGLQQLDDHFRREIDSRTFEELAYESKLQVLDDLFPGEIRGLAVGLTRLAARDRNARDLPPSDLLAALIEVTAALPVYRTYIRDGSVSEDDRHWIAEAIKSAGKRMKRPSSPYVFRFLERVLLVDPPHYAADAKEEWLAFVMRWQQFTGRLMAKGVEDTAFYVHNRLLPVNEVGGDPMVEAVERAVEKFHRQNGERLETWPHSMIATSTHDTKRSEDVRARLDVLSEIPRDWLRTCRRWSKQNEEKKTHVDGLAAPDPNEEIVIYQSLLGIWPLEEKDGWRDDLRDRMLRFVEKAMREAKVHTSWVDVREPWESAVKRFVERLFEDDAFLDDVRRMHRRIVKAGIVNSLAQVTLKIASPGVPDFYQGTEGWDFSLVDPDNRRPVDYERHRKLLRRDASPEALLRDWKSGAIKMHLTRRGLRLRRETRDLFLEGRYEPLRVSGEKAENVVAFARSHGDDWLIALAPRLVRSLAPTGWPLGDVWGDTAITLPDGAPRRWRDVYSGIEVEAVDGALQLRDALASLPVALLVAAS